MNALSNRSHGITLIEMLIVLAIIAILAGTALPSFKNLGQASATRSARMALSTAIGETRMSAVMRNQYAVLCPSADQEQCDQNLKWHKGWILFIDENRNGRREPTEAILSLSQAQPAGVAIVSSSGRHRIRYQADGTSDGSNLTLTFCDRRGPASASTLVINNAGRMRTGTPSASQASAACNAIDS
jgi:type IV fimbrial biogenesis protein FimT